jgi:hypothetical protein
VLDALIPGVAGARAEGVPVDADARIVEVVVAGAGVVDDDQLPVRVGLGDDLGDGAMDSVGRR